MNYFRLIRDAARKKEVNRGKPRETLKGENEGISLYTKVEIQPP